MEDKSGLYIVAIVGVVAVVALVVMMTGNASVTDSTGQVAAFYYDGGCSGGSSSTCGAMTESECKSTSNCCFWGVDRSTSKGSCRYLAPSTESYALE